MLSFTFALLIAFLMGLMVARGIRLRARIRERLGPARPQVDDDAVRRIIEEGVLSHEEDEPLDFDEIAEEERRFLSETNWDEPEEW